MEDHPAYATCTRFPYVSGSVDRGDQKGSPSFLFEVFEAAAVARVGEISGSEVLKGLDGRQFLEGPGVARLQLAEGAHACGGQGSDSSLGDISERKREKYYNT